jgi:hypothetical protein
MLMSPAPFAATGKVPPIPALSPSGGPPRPATEFAEGPVTGARSQLRSVLGAAVMRTI